MGGRRTRRCIAREGMRFFTSGAGSDLAEHAPAPGTQGLVYGDNVNGVLSVSLVRGGACPAV